MGGWLALGLQEVQQAADVLIAAMLSACTLSARCPFCESENADATSGAIVHEPDCTGIAALKAAGVET